MPFPRLMNPAGTALLWRCSAGNTCRAECRDPIEVQAGLAVSAHSWGSLVAKPPLCSAYFNECPDHNKHAICFKVEVNFAGTQSQETMALKQNFLCWFTVYQGAPVHNPVASRPPLTYAHQWPFPIFSCCPVLPFVFWQAKAHVRELQSQIVSATLQQLAKDAAELAEDAEVSGSGSDDDHTMAAGGNVLVLLWAKASTRMMSPSSPPRLSLRYG
eukprot:1161894-Pelagomonas_calceolata.AAC.5